MLHYLIKTCMKLFKMKHDLMFPFDIAFFDSALVNYALFTVQILNAVLC